MQGRRRRRCGAAVAASTAGQTANRTTAYFRDAARCGVAQEQSEIACLHAGAARATCGIPRHRDFIPHRPEHGTVGGLGGTKALDEQELYKPRGVDDGGF
jgi:hypothetical protein